MNQQGQWQVAGSAPEVYEGELVPAVFGVWAPILVELAQLRPSERVLDVACGTGVVARIAAKRVGPSGTVVGIDLNPGMLSVARSVESPDSRSGGQLQWQEAVGHGPQTVSSVQPRLSNSMALRGASAIEKNSSS
jgi:SAM-dependent methyltransferase